MNKENYFLNSLMNTEAKLFSKIPTDKLKQSITKIIQHDQGKFTSEMQKWFTLPPQILELRKKYMLPR